MENRIENMNAKGGEGKGQVSPNLWLVLFSYISGFKYIHTNIQQQCLNLISIKWIKKRKIQQKAHLQQVI